jgi:glycosyltransferase involved in cell wall biosynthesis
MADGIARTDAGPGMLALNEAPAARTRQPTVKVCILTYGRPQLLERCLKTVDAQRFDRIATPDVRIAVIDNHPTPLVTRETVARWVGRWPFVVVHQPIPGIAVSRNAAMLAAEPREADFIAFIDDDEYASPHWLEELLLVQAATGAAVVSAPCAPLVPDDAPAWFARAGFGQPPSKPDRAPVTGAATNNVLFSAALPARGLRFEEGLSLCMGEDTLFFDDARRAGFAMAWAANATVYEEVPRERMSSAWLIRRWLSFGFTQRYILLRRMGKAAALGHLAFHGTRRTLAGLSFIPVLLVAPFVGWDIVMKRVHHFCRGVSMLLALAGIYAGERKR